jgi:SSS family solute:Na+ symporter
MRMFAARNEWHLKMSIFAASVPLLAMTFFNLSIGVMGRALMPEQADLPFGRQDSIYPLLASQVATVGLKGIVVAGMLAAALSTYDSIGSSLSALLTRDVYARLLVRDRDDHHYLRVGQWLTPIIILGSFAYVPFMDGGMLKFYVDITSTFVMPLLTLFLMGTMTRVHRRSGLIGLMAGVLYGVVRMLSPMLADSYGIAVLPVWLANSWAAYPFSMAVSAGTMVIVSLFTGFSDRATQVGQTHKEDSPWLRDSLQKVREINHGHEGEDKDGLSMRLPIALAAIAIITGCVLSFVILW